MRWLKHPEDAGLGPDPTLLKPIRTPDALEEALADPLVLLFKHSTACWLSQQAKRQIEAFASARPDVPVHVVDVLEDRPLSQGIEQKFDIRHESPQAILVRSGQPVWNASHRAVTKDDVLAAIDETQPSG